MLSIFSKKRKYTDLSWMIGDLNTHLLPGLDDGSRNFKESTFMFKGLSDLGLTSIYCTPRIDNHLYPNTVSDIQQSFIRFQEEIPEHYEHIAVAGEYMINDDFERTLLARDPLMAYPTGHILIEMPYISISASFASCLQLLQERGYTPILSSPERYVYYQDHLNLIKKIKENGCEIQLNILSLYGYFGYKEKEFAKDLIQTGLVDYLGTDTRYERHIKALQHFVSKQDLSDLAQKATLKNESFFAGGK